MLAVHKKTLIKSALLGASGVMIMALAAHALKQKLDTDSLESVHTASLLQMIHALALLGIAQLAHLGKHFRLSALFLFWGTILFSGSIYLLVFLKPFLPFLRFFWPITPLGGLVLIGGWLILLKAGITIQHNGKS
jgi:uncharacterized membrane protein YgdD (TMEM256/DUF423 family)